MSLNKDKRGFSGLGGLVMGIGFGVIILVAIALVLSRFDTAINATVHTDIANENISYYAENISDAGQLAVWTVASFLGVFAVIGVLVLIIAMLVKAFGGGGGTAI